MHTTPEIDRTHHCHTHWSDGSHSAAEMVDAAEQLGFAEIGFSDHLVLHPARLDISWSMNPAHLDDCVREVREAAAHASISVKLGLEVDFFPDNPRQAELDELLARHPFDYLIGSVHMIDDFPLDSSATDWQRLTKSEVDALYIRYWQTLKQLAQTPGFDIIAHLDLPKKFGFYPQVDISAVEGLALDTIAGSKKIVELNTAGWDKPCAECYPSPRLLRLCRLREIPIIINDDAHAVDQLGRHYPQAAALINSTPA